LKFNCFIAILGGRKPDFLLLKSLIELGMEYPMKKSLWIVGLFLLTLLFSNHAVARNTVLTAAEANKLLTDRTMTVTEAEPDKKTGKTVSFTAYFTDLGAIRTLHPDGSSQTFSWAINEDGVLCVKNNMRWAGGVCGFLVSDDRGSHKLYRNRRGTSKVQKRNGRVIFMSDWKHFLTFSNIKAGKHL